MYFEEDKTYHIYNRSNETIFYNRDNYLYFLNKMNQLILPFSDILSYCLMPNHFHILLVAKPEGCKYIDEAHRPKVQQLSKNIGTLLSSYTRALNKSTRRKGKLFAHSTKSKCLNDDSQNRFFLENCFHYIHQNPIMAELCHDMKDWEFSSYRDFAGLRNGKLINKELAYEMIDIDPSTFIEQSKVIVGERIMEILSL